MIDKTALKEFIENRLAESGYFLVDLKVSADNDIVVEIDNPEAVDIDYCVALSREIEQAFPRDKEDYSLEVGSAGLTAPFKVLGQYIKNVGRQVEVLTSDGRKLKGILDEADESGFTLGVEKKVRLEGKKRPEIITEQERFAFTDVKKVNVIPEF